MQFGNKFSGTFNGEKTTVNIGVKDGEAMPYELLLERSEHAIMQRFMK